MKNNREILIFENSYNLSNYLIKQFTDMAHGAVEQRNRFCVALSGGNTPKEFYTMLSKFNDFDLWQKTHIFQVDERFVPFEDKENNYRMIKENLIDYINIPKENVHPISVDVENVNLSAEHYKDTLLHFFDFKAGELPCFDLVLLGLGEDGHTASLFEHMEGINDPRRVTTPVSCNFLKNERVSLTLPVINNARTVIFLVLGEGKADIVKRIIEEETKFPAALVKPAYGKASFLLDGKAAQKLSYKDNYTHLGEAISLKLPYE